MRHAAALSSRLPALFTWHPMPQRKGTHHGRGEDGIRLPPTRRWEPEEDLEACLPTAPSLHTGLAKDAGQPSRRVRRRNGNGNLPGGGIGTEASFESSFHTGFGGEASQLNRPLLRSLAIHFEFAGKQREHTSFHAFACTCSRTLRLPCSSDPSWSHESNTAASVHTRLYPSKLTLQRSTFIRMRQLLSFHAFHRTCHRPFATG